MTEKEKMLNGEMYNPQDEELRRDRYIARRIVKQLNELHEEHEIDRAEMLRELLGTTGENVYVESNFRVDYGENIHVGDNFFANFDCTILDPAPVTIGDNCFLGPGVHIYTPLHPLDPTERSFGLEYALPVTIEKDVWVGGRAVINPGVTIGEGAVIASGSVVTKDVLPRTVVAGSPAREIKKI